MPISDPDPVVVVMICDTTGWGVPSSAIIVIYASWDMILTQKTPYGKNGIKVDLFS